MKQNKKSPKWFSFFLKKKKSIKIKYKFKNQVTYWENNNDTPLSPKKFSIEQIKGILIINKLIYHDTK